MNTRAGEQKENYDVRNTPPPFSYEKNERITTQEGGDSILTITVGENKLKDPTFESLHLNREKMCLF